MTVAAIPQSHAGLGFNCAAPFRERLFARNRYGILEQVGFNCAAPFRERL